MTYRQECCPSIIGHNHGSSGVIDTHPCLTHKKFPSQQLLSQIMTPVFDLGALLMNSFSF